MALSETVVLEALRVVQDPDLHRDIVTLGFVKNVKISGGRRLHCRAHDPACPVKDLLRDQARAVVSALPGVSSVAVEMTAQVRRDGRKRDARQLTASKISLQWVRARAASGRRPSRSTSLWRLRPPAVEWRCSTRTCSPNVPIMLGFEKGLRLEQDGKHILPAEACGVQTVSMGFLTADDAPVIWRGPMLHGAIQQFSRCEMDGCGLPDCRHAGNR